MMEEEKGKKYNIGSVKLFIERSLAISITLILLIIFFLTEARPLSYFSVFLISSVLIISAILTILLFIPGLIEKHAMVFGIGMLSIPSYVLIMVGIEDKQIIYVLFGIFIFSPVIISLLERREITKLLRKGKGEN